VKVEARTREGEIESDFDEIKVENHDRESNASGSIGSNGPKLVMNCEKGGIEIRKGTVAAVALQRADSAHDGAQHGQAGEGFAGSEGEAGGERELGRAAVGSHNQACALADFANSSTAGKDRAVVKVVSGGSVPVVIDFTINSIAKSAFGGMKIVAVSKSRRTQSCPVLGSPSHPRNGILCSWSRISGSSSKALRAPIAMESSWAQTASIRDWREVESWSHEATVLWRSIRSNGPSGRAVARPRVWF